MVLLDSGKFLTELHRLCEANKDKGSVFVTMKRSACPGVRAGKARWTACRLPSRSRRGTPAAGRRRPSCLPGCPCPGNLKPRKGPKDYSDVPCKCLVRATDGKRKLSTVLAAAELPRFQDSYATIMRVSWGARALSGVLGCYM